MADEFLVDKAYEILKNYAHKKRNINYGELYNQLGLDHNSEIDRYRGSDILTEVNKRTINENGVMISSIIIKLETGFPGAKFFSIAKELGRLEKGVTKTEKMVFWVKEMERAFEIYSKETD